MNKLSIFVQADLQGEILNITVTWKGNGIWAPLNGEVEFSESNFLLQANKRIFVLMSNTKHPLNHILFLGNFQDVRSSNSRLYL